MKTNLYTIHDKEADTWSGPYNAPNDTVLLRQINTQVNSTTDANNAWSTNPEDFDVYQIGEFDNETGDVHLQKTKLINLAMMRKPAPKKDN